MVNDGAPVHKFIKMNAGMAFASTKVFRCFLSLTFPLFFFKPNHFLSNKPGHLIEIKIGIRPTTEEKEVFDEMEN